MASLRIPAKPLLESGHRSSSSHLGLIALDPARSILSPSVLRQMKLNFIREGCGRPSEEEVEKKEQEKKKRSARQRMEDEEEEQKMKKRQKMIPIVPLQSLLTLEKQLSRDSADGDGDEREKKRDSRSASPAAAESETREFAALALARHLVDWTEGLGCTFFSDDEEEEEDEEKSEAQLAAEAEIAAAMDDTLPPVHPSSIQPIYSSAELAALTSCFEEEEESPFDSGSEMSEAPTPSLEMMERSESSRTLSTMQQEEQEDEAAEQQQQQQHFVSSDELSMLQRMLESPRAPLTEMLTIDTEMGIAPELPSSIFLLSPHHPMTLSPFAVSPKTSPLLTYQLQSHELQPQPLMLDDQQLPASPTLASTMTSAGDQMISLIQHQRAIWA